jgi:DNA polymerase I-like protein with 3'-5' exonuclease and polymerase domains
MPPTCKRCIECAETLRDNWFKTYRENRDYFKHISALLDNAGEMVQHYSGRIRGGINFCSAANSYFQGLGGDVTKLALERVTIEQYTDKTSDLFGSRTILMLHDELFCEVAEEQADAAARRLSAVMVGALQEVCPDLAPAAAAPPALMRRWYKGADTVYNEQGELIPWEP